VSKQKNETRHSLDFGVVIIDKEKKRWKCFSLAFQKEKKQKNKKEDVGVQNTSCCETVKVILSID